MNFHPQKALRKTIQEKQKRKAPERYSIPLEPSHEYLPESPSHYCPQKVRGLVESFTWLRRIATIKKYSYGNR
jgi:hypothetical protein